MDTIRWQCECRAFSNQCQTRSRTAKPAKSATPALPLAPLGDYRGGRCQGENSLNLACLVRFAVRSASDLDQQLDFENALSVSDISLCDDIGKDISRTQESWNIKILFFSWLYNWASKGG